MIRQIHFIAVLVVIFTCTAISAQEAGKVGLDFRAGSQSSIGVIWHITDNFAFRPSLTYESQETEILYYYYPYYQTITQKVHEYGTNLAFLFNVYSRENLILYAGGALEYIYITYNRGDDVRSKGAQALFGMRHTLGKRLSIFGEVGARYRTDDIEMTSTEYGLFTAGLGLTIYLK